MDQHWAAKGLIDYLQKFGSNAQELDWDYVVHVAQEAKVYDGQRK